MSLKTGTIPRVMIGYLRSYEGIGDAKVAISPGSPSSYKLVGYHSAKDSQVEPHMHNVFMAETKKMFQAVFVGNHSMLSNVDVNITIENLSNKKVKIVYVVSC